MDLTLDKIKSMTSNEYNANRKEIVAFYKTNGFHIKPIEKSMTVLLIEKYKCYSRFGLISELELLKNRKSTYAKSYYLRKQNGKEFLNGLPKV